VMTVCYQADADFNQVIVTGLLRREPAIDFQTAHAADLRGVKFVFSVPDAIVSIYLMSLKL
ncbi:MAG: hypothetical protein AB4042_07840, partial [Leptolyngbyaceae cyanobacterium]